LTLFGHIARIDDSIDTKQILISSPPVDCMEETFGASTDYLDENASQ